MKLLILAFALMTSFSISAMADDEHCHIPEPSTEWTCFARDANGKSLGISRSFTERRLAAARAIASCQRKSPIPQTCHITLCKLPDPECH